jgi:hypothetical protein
MRPVVPLLLAVLAAVVLVPSAAQARVTVGIGQQTPEIFRSPEWAALDAPDVRYIAPWDVIDDPAELDKLIAWMDAADGSGARVLVGFQHSMRSERLAKTLPSPTQYRDAFVRLRERFPEIRTWVPWNEANNGTLTGKNPKRAAQYYNVVREECPGCSVVAGDVLDQRNLERWLKQYKRGLEYTPRIWGLHNYHDANARTDKSTKLMLRLTKGQLWFTETGGVIKFRVATPRGVILKNYGIRKAADATRYALNLSKLSPRITRIYLYHWLAPSRFTTWDSALTDSQMQPRQGYRVVASWLKTARKQGRAN